MKNFDTRAYSINDFREWHKAGQLELSPRFQRRSVWSEKAKSFLIDTILRGKPIPKLFIRQKISPSTSKSVREVVDGQQRLRTILSYLDDGFQVSKRHNDRYGGLYYSQLPDNEDEDIKSAILNYELSVDLLINMPDPEILDVFSRLNSYAVVLNQQEKLNAKYFGPFKRLSDTLAHQYVDFWTTNGILTDGMIMRMGDVTLVADLLIGMMEGIKAKKQIPTFYASYERTFEHSVDELRTRFHQTLTDVSSTFSAGLASTPFAGAPLFYGVFMSLYHLRHGVVGLELPSYGDAVLNYSRIREALEVVASLFADENTVIYNDTVQEFIDGCRRRTADAQVRRSRVKFLTNSILAAQPLLT